MMHSIAVLGGMRTPMADYNGNFSNLSALELGGIAAKAALDKTGVSPNQIDHVVFGNALQTSGDAIYGARHVGLRAGIPFETPALTVNRLCGSGFQSLVSASHIMLVDGAEVVLAGGMENMSQAPYVVRGARQGLRLGNAPFADYLMEALLDTQCGFYMAQTAENLARKYDISRDSQDVFALRSQQAAEKAYSRGFYAEEIVPVTVKKGRKTFQMEADDHLTPDTTLEGLGGLRPAFSKDGCVTAGNASGIVDGAASVVLATDERAKKEGWPVLGHIRAWSYAGVPPEIMGFGPVPAIQKLLEETQISLDAIDRIEINEAFAAQYLACEKALDLDRDKVNVNGGAIALGHPLAATGTRLVLTVLRQLKECKGRYGIASACIGGGQGMAILVEAV